MTCEKKNPTRFYYKDKIRIEQSCNQQKVSKTSVEQTKSN